MIEIPRIIIGSLPIERGNDRVKPVAEETRLAVTGRADTSERRHRAERRRRRQFWPQELELRRHQDRRQGHHVDLDV